MNVLIRFEDRYGCKTLFVNSNSCLVSSDISYDLGNTKVFKVSKKLASGYDYIIIVFDLDSADNLSLTKEELIDLVSKNFYNSEGTLKDCYRDKIILIPVYFCYETMTLFSSYIRDSILKSRLGNSDSEKLISLYKRYYNYGVVSPEVLKDFALNINDICNKMNDFLFNKTSKTWYPQTFHKSYSKHSLKLMVKDLNLSTSDLVYKRLGDNLFDKHEDELYAWFNRVGVFDFPDTIIEGLSASKHNNYFYKLLTLTDENYLSSMILENTLNDILSDLDLYNKEVRGLETTANIAAGLRNTIYKV